MTELPRVTDHCVLRYLERECGVPVESVRRLLALRAATGEVEGALQAGRRVKIVLANGVAVTVLKRHWRTREEREQ